MTRPASYEDPGDRFASPAYDDWLDKATSVEAIGAIAKAMVEHCEDIFPSAGARESLCADLDDSLGDWFIDEDLAAAAVAVGFCEPFEGGE